MSSWKALPPPRPRYAFTGRPGPVKAARIDKPAGLSLTATEDAWSIDGVWDGIQEIAVNLPTDLRCERRWAAPPPCCGATTCWSRIARQRMPG